MEPPWDGGTKVCSNDNSHMTKMAPCPNIIIHVTVMNLLRNRLADIVEIWYTASGTQVLNSSQVKIKYEFSKPFRSKRFSKDENHAESEQFL